METDDTQKRFLALLEESAKREQELKQALLEARWSQESTAAKAANLEVKLKELQRSYAELQKEVDEQAIVNGKGSEREAALLSKLETLQREYAALENLIIKTGYIITNFNGEMALCRDPWHQPKEEQP